MFASMIPKLQKTLEFHTAFDMIDELKKKFQVQAMQECSEINSCKMSKGTFVSSHVLKMKGYRDLLGCKSFD